MTALDRTPMKDGGTPPADLQPIARSDAETELDSFVYIVSHDLRNSARALSEVPKWLRDDLDAQGTVLSGEVAENFELLERHARRLDRMLLDLLVFSRVGRMQTVAELDLEHVINATLSEASVPEWMRVELPSHLPPLIMGDKDASVLFKTVFDNIARHCVGGETVLRIDGIQQDDTVILTLTDNGPGVGTADIQRIFRPMSTLRRRDEVEGSGMGLAILHRIVTHYGGTVAAGAGEDGRGLRIRIALPQSVARAMVAESTNARL